MIALPVSLAPPAPFPLIVAQAKSESFVAPGVVLDTYHLQTSRGPLVVRAVVVDARTPTIRIGTVLAHDVLRSAGESISSMAKRTEAVAGINADYFDIGQTNQPLNLVVQNGILLRSPSGRATLTVAPGGTVRLGTYRFSGSVSDADRSWPLEGVDEWPPQGAGTMLIHPAFGQVPQYAARVLVSPVDPSQHAAAVGISADFRVVGDGTNCARCSAIAFGARALDANALPQPGDVLRIEAALDPEMPPGATAVGGGPLLVRDGAPYADPDPPSPAETLQRDPQAGVADLTSGTLALVCVDGRIRDESIGLTRPELSALFVGIRAQAAMAFDSGGSATLVVRTPGDHWTTLANRPSDGHERAVADGLFVYSDAPSGPPARLAVRPQPLNLLSGAQTRIVVVPTDAAGHPTGPPALPDRLAVDPPSVAKAAAQGLLVGAAAGSATLTVRLGGLRDSLPLRVVSSIARLRVDPPEPNPERGESVDFTADGLDAAGEPVAVGGRVRWSASGGSIAPDGRYVAGTSDAVVTAAAAGRSIETVVRVGKSEGPLPLFTRPGDWHFTTFPTGGHGSLALDPQAPGGAALELKYDLATARGAYAATAMPLPGAPLAIALDVRGDGSGVGLRAAFDNADGDRVAVTLAKRVDWKGWRRCAAMLPPTAVPPLRLRSLYVVSALSGPATHGAGTLAFRAPRATFAGSHAP